MQCVICKHGATHTGSVTTTLHRGETTVIFKGVPAEVCENCGEHYFDAAVTAALLERAEQAVRSGAEVEILRYAA